MWRWLTGFFVKDAKLFCADRQAVVMAFVIPLLIASILGWLDSSADTPGQKVPLIIVDQDNSEASRAVISKLSHSDLVSVRLASLADARRDVNNGQAPAAAVIPKAFGVEGVTALSGGAKPVVQLLTDPSQPQSVQIAKGAILADASGALATSAFGGLAGNGEAPLKLEEHEAAAKSVPWGKAAHDYAGFGLQGLLFFAVEAAAALSRERRQGIWRRIRSAPVPPWVLVFSKGINSAILAFGIVLTLFLVGALLFGIRLEGSVSGFFLIAIASALMASTFGLLIATLAKNENQARPAGFLVILVMLATGGAWFPMARMPSWVQHLADFMPVRWAVEGFDAVTWRGLGLQDALRHAGVLVLFALVFGVIATWRFSLVADKS